MGNTCCRGEEASSMVFPHFHSTEKESLLDHKTSSLASANEYSSSADNYYDDDKQHREVKIKITKEKLEELLSTADVHGMSVDQVVARLLSASADHHYYRSWRPALQTIPEVH